MGSEAWLYSDTYAAPLSLQRACKTHTLTAFSASEYTIKTRTDRCNTVLCLCRLQAVASALWPAQVPEMQLLVMEGWLREQVGVGVAVAITAYSSTHATVPLCGMDYGIVQPSLGPTPLEDNTCTCARMYTHTHCDNSCQQVQSRQPCSLLTTHPPLCGCCVVAAWLLPAGL